jgi:hypothetical protein
MAPWSMKALFGAFADAVPLFGYHKRSYIIIMSAAGGIGCLFLALGTKDPKVATAWFFLINLQISVSDLLTEGKYAELMSLRYDLSKAPPPLPPTPAILMARAANH